VRAVFDSLSDPGDVPADLRDLHRRSRPPHIEATTMATGWEGFRMLADLHPELAEEMAAARQRWDRPDTPDAEAWLRDLLDRALSHRDRTEDDKAVPHDCVCGREGDVPFAPGTRGVLTCDACGKRWGVTAFDAGGGLIWPLGP
jgi:hypothetical protein